MSTSCQISSTSKTSTSCQIYLTLCVVSVKNIWGRNVHVLSNIFDMQNVQVMSNIFDNMCGISVVSCQIYLTWCGRFACRIYLTWRGHFDIKCIWLILHILSNIFDMMWTFCYNAWQRRKTHYICALRCLCCDMCVLRYVAVCCSVLQCVAVCRSVRVSAERGRCRWRCAASWCIYGGTHSYARDITCACVWHEFRIWQVT